MYKVLIVDDEIFVRMGLKNSIEWEKNGFLLIGEASNGVQALNIMKMNQPDIVITDIKMPEMGGVELIDNISKKYPDTKCIVLSNYDDFELVKEALKNGAEDYFLKVTIETEKLLEALKDMCKQLEIEKSSKNNVIRIKETLNDHRAVIKSKFIEDMTNLSISIEIIRNKINTLGLKLYYRKGCFLFFTVLNYHDILKTRFDSDNNLFVFSVLNITEEIVNYHLTGEVFEYSGNFIAIITDENDIGRNKTKFVAEHIKSAAKEYLSMDVAVVHGFEFDTLETLRVKLLALDEAKLLAFYANEGIVLNKDENLFSVEEPGEFLREIKKELETYIHLCDMEEIRSSFKKIYNFMQSNCIFPASSKRMMIQTINFMIDKLIQKDIYSGDMAVENAVVNVQNCVTFYELKDICDHFVENYIELIRHGSSNQYRTEIKKVIEYIHHHLDAKISLEDMAKYVSMNKSYFSRLFKQETGEQFQLFLIRVRMEKAEDYIRNTDRKLSDIAAAIGYSDIFYFNKVFKSYFKKSPGEYRKNRE